METNQNYKQLHTASSFVLQMWKIFQTMQIVEKCDNISKCLNLAWSHKYQIWYMMQYYTVS